MEVKFLILGSQCLLRIILVENSLGERNGVGKSMVITGK